VKLIIVDRDGAVSHEPDGRAARAGDWQSHPGSAAAIARLAHGGWRIALLADRGPLARGACDMAALNAMHARLIAEVVEHGGRIDAVLFVDPVGTPERSARVTAMLEDSLARLGIAPESAVLVADTAPDLEAARAAGCRAVLVLTGRGRQTLEANALPAGTVVRVDLAAVAAELAA